MSTENHYNSCAITARFEPIDVCDSMDFCTGNIVKYMCRYRYKGTPEADLKKAIYYAKRLKEVRFMRGYAHAPASDTPYYPLENYSPILELFIKSPPHLNLLFDADQAITPHTIDRFIAAVTQELETLTACAYPIMA